MGNPRQTKGRNKPTFIAEQTLAVISTYVIDDELS